MSRTGLTSDTEFFVRKDGNDSNSGLANSSSSAFKTIQHAINHVASKIDLQGYTATITVTPGVYNEALVLKPTVGGGEVNITGVGNTTNLFTSGSQFAGIQVGDPNSSEGGINNYQFLNLKLDCDGTTTFLVYVCGQNTLELQAIEYGKSGFVHNQVEHGGRLVESGAIIGGNSCAFIKTAFGGKVYSAGTHLFKNNPSFAFSYIFASDQSCVYVNPSLGFSGSFTGTRYFADSFGLIQTYTGNTQLFPGTANGIVTSTGYYN